MQIDLGDIITFVLIGVTALLNFIRSKTKIETRLDFLASQVEKQNSNVAKLQEWQLHHMEFHSDKK